MNHWSKNKRTSPPHKHTWDKIMCLLPSAHFQCDVPRVSSARWSGRWGRCLHPRWHRGPGRAPWVSGRARDFYTGHRGALPGPAPAGGRLHIRRLSQRVHLPHPGPPRGGCRWNGTGRTRHWAGRVSRCRAGASLAGPSPGFTHPGPQSSSVHCLWPYHVTCPSIIQTANWKESDRLYDGAKTTAFTPNLPVELK